MEEADRRAIAALIAQRRWAALATVDTAGAPHASMVAYAAAPDFSAVALHLSRLAAHTSNLLARPAAALVIGAEDSGRGDPQVLARVALEGEVLAVHPDAPEHAALKALYLSRLPRAAPRFEFEDFLLLRFTPRTARYVGGFGRAWTLDGAALRACAGAAGVRRA